MGGLVRPFVDGVVRSTAGELAAVLVQTPLTTPDLAAQPRVRDLWTASLTVAIACYVLFIVAGGVLVMAHESVQTRYALREIAPRLVIGMVAAASSLSVVDWAIRVCNAVSVALLGRGIDLGRALRSLLMTMTTPVLGGGWLVLLLELAGLVLLIALMVALVVRVVVTLLLVVAAPLALACHALPVTDAVARAWWRLLAAVLAVEVVESLSLIIAVRVLSNSDGRQASGLLPGGQVVNLIVTVCLIYVMVKVPVWAFRMALQRTGHRSPLLVRMAVWLAAGRLLRGAERSLGRFWGGWGSGPAPGAGSGGGPRGGGGPSGGWWGRWRGRAAGAGAAAAGAVSGGAGAAGAAGRAAGAGAGRRVVRPRHSAPRPQAPARGGYRAGWAARPTSPPVPPSPSAGDGPRPGGVAPQPRWARPEGRWLPPDLQWYRRVQPRPGSGPESNRQQRRWGPPDAPVQQWPAPYAGPWQQPPHRPRPVPRGRWPQPRPPQGPGWRSP
ncbi:hypothetical protein [Actinomadura rupiterrae]|uniref:hypothetical protein n=1 Tax=Actinomadura rupiterrae TaxID=559627 RepID=UPI0020A3176D|nr:hypothetical protein [Actinomadura rupiterrae]MCP2341174.1 hypothetical protein [Actinomadura rupiterrae]